MAGDAAKSLLNVNPDAGFIVSLHIALGYLSYGLVNLAGKIIRKKIFTYPFGSAPHTVLDELDKKLNQILEETQIDKKVIFGVGVAIPGIINYEEGNFREKTLEGWQNFPLRSFLEDLLNEKVYIENDVKTNTLGEFQFGTSRYVRDMVCLWLEDGIGAGIINDGRLLRGVTSSAGEIGFNEFILDMPRTKSILIASRPRFWGEILSVSNIKKTIQRGLAEGWNSILTENADINDFVHAVEISDPLALYILRLLGEVLAKVGANIIYSINPQVLLLSGPLFHRLPQLIDEIRSHLNKFYLQSPIEAVELKTSILGEDGVTIGCAALVLEHLFKGSEFKSMHS
jgi:predicted NBD/HSP70 family sugar kinase